MKNKKIALITGASNGIGLELAKKFASNDFNLIIVARDEQKLQDTKADLEKLGSVVETYSADLANFEEISGLKAWVDEQDYAIDSLVINAGQGIGGKFIGEIPLEKELNLIRLNVDSYVHLAKLFIPDLVARKSGRVLMTSSLSGTSPIPFEAVYGASKAFVNSLFYAIRNEISGSGVDMTLLMPGATETNFFKNAGLANTRVGSMQKDDPKEVAERAWYALMSGHDHVYGSDQSEYEGDIYNRMQSETQKAQRRRLFSAPDSVPGASK